MDFTLEKTPGIPRTQRISSDFCLSMAKTKRGHNLETQGKRRRDETWGPKCVKETEDWSCIPNHAYIYRYNMIYQTYIIYIEVEKQWRFR